MPYGGRRSIVSTCCQGVAGVISTSCRARSAPSRSPSGRGRFAQAPDRLSRRLVDRLVGPLAHPHDLGLAARRGRVAGPGWQVEVRVHHPALSLDRRVAHVQGARAVDRDVTGPGRERDLGQTPGAAEEGGLHERTVGARHDGELAGTLVGPRHGDPDREAAAAVGVTAEAAVLVPGDVGDAFDDTDRLDEGLDGVALGAEAVALVGESPDPQEAVVGQQRRGGRALLVEVLQPHRPPRAVHGRRPPRAAVVGLVVPDGRVDLGVDLLHLPRAEHVGEVEEAGLLEEVQSLSRVVVRREATVQVQRFAGTVSEVDRPGGVDGTPVDQGAQDHPPVEEVAADCPAACRASRRSSASWASAGRRRCPSALLRGGGRWRPPPPPRRPRAPHHRRPSSSMRRRVSRRSGGRCRARAPRARPGASAPPPTPATGSRTGPRCRRRPRRRRTGTGDRGAREEG